MSKVLKNASLAHQEAVEAYLPVIPTASSRRLYEKVTSGRAGRALAIKAKCQNCVSYEDTVDRIRHCSSYRCPLWRLRPYQNDEQEQSAKRDGVSTQKPGVTR